MKRMCPPLITKLKWLIPCWFIIKKDDGFWNVYLNPVYSHPIPWVYVTENSV